MTKITLDEYLAEIEELRNVKIEQAQLTNDAFQCIHAGRSKEPVISWYVLHKWCTDKGLITCGKTTLREKYTRELSRRKIG